MKILFNIQYNRVQVLTMATRSQYIWRGKQNGLLEKTVGALSRQTADRQIQTGQFKNHWVSMTECLKQLQFCTTAKNTHSGIHGDGVSKETGSHWRSVVFLLHTLHSSFTVSSSGITTVSVLQRDYSTDFF